MKKLLYLKDYELNQYIEKIFTGYRETVSDAKKVLDKYSIGVAHNKVIHLISLYEGISISELLKKLKVTKQSLNRVLKDLIKDKFIYLKKDGEDGRKRLIFLDRKGEIVFNEIFLEQKKRIYKALKNSDAGSVINFRKVLTKIINE